MKGHKIRPYPIFNHGETNLPYAYQYIEDFNPSWDINDIDIHCTHADLDLKALQIDYDYFLPDEYARNLYHGLHDQLEEKTKKICFIKSFNLLRMRRLKIVNSILRRTSNGSSSRIC